MFRRRRSSVLSFRQKKKIITPGLVREILSWVIYSLIAIFFAFVLVLAFGMRIQVMGESMEPGLENGNNVLVDRLIYKLKRPKHGDIVVFHPRGNERSRYYIRRVVGVPGDTIEIKGGYLYVNDERSTVYVQRIDDPGMARGGITLDQGEYFVLGDDPDIGEDSRSDNLGPVAQELIIGKVWFVLEEIGKKK